MEQQNAQTAYIYKSLQVNLNAMLCLVNFLIFDLNLLYVCGKNYEQLIFNLF